jgi:murein DD-endopeptidase MepM/ murein hydrolase activator NlpD
MVRSLLLPHNRFAHHDKEARQVRDAVRFFYLTFLPLLILSVFGCSRDGPAKDPDSLTRSEVVVEAGWAFETALWELSVPPDLNSSIVKSLEGVLDFRRCKPGDIAALVTSPDGEFVRFEYRHAPTRYYVVEPSDSGMAAREVSVETQQKLHYYDGTIESSLSRAVEKVTGKDQELAFLISDIFAWDIDFNVETRKGDRFTALVVREYVDDTCVKCGPVLYATYSGYVGNYDATRFEDTKGNSDYFDPKGKSLKKMFLKSPLQYRRISSYFSKRRYHPILKIYRPHYGIDYVASVGTPVSSIGDGTVSFAGWKGGYGKLVYVAHGKGFQSGYGHLSKFARGIRKGVRVHQGQLIGYVGTTGLSTGPHLHFELKRHGTFINPLRAKIPAADPVSEARMDLFRQERERVASLARAFGLLETSKGLAQFGREPDTQAESPPEEQDTD